MGAPSMKISPAVGVSKPAINLRRVVLPQPLGPKRVTNCPRLMPRLRSSRTVTLSNTLVIPLISMIFSLFFCGTGRGSAGATASFLNNPLIFCNIFIFFFLYQKLGGQEIQRTVAFLSVKFSIECFLSAL